MIQIRSSSERKSLINPYMPNGLVHPYHLDESISNFRGVIIMHFIILILFLIEDPLRKPCRP